MKSQKRTLIIIGICAWILFAGFFLFNEQEANLAILVLSTAVVLAFTYVAHVRKYRKL